MLGKHIVIKNWKLNIFVKILNKNEISNDGWMIEKLNIFLW